MAKSYKPTYSMVTVKDGRLVENPKWKVKRTEYLSGLFTHRYKDRLYLQYRCPLCGEDIQVARQLQNNMPVDYESHVAGEMVNYLRADLAVHYKRECGSGTERRKQMGEMLFDKFMDGYYE